MLQSPFFLYHVDVGAGAPSATPVRLTSYELASRLSYFLWNTMPDEALFALRRRQHAAGRRGARRRRSSACWPTRAPPTRSRRSTCSGWGSTSLEAIEKDARCSRSATRRWPTAMRAETAAFTDHVVRRGDGLLSTLLTASFSFPQGPLFQLYGVTQPAGFRAGDQVTLDASQRGGILTQARVPGRARAPRPDLARAPRHLRAREHAVPAAAAAAARREHDAAAADDGGDDARALREPRIRRALRRLPPAHRPHRPGVRELRRDRRLPDEEGGVADRRLRRSGGRQGQTWPASSSARSSSASKLAASPDVANCVANQWFRFALGPHGSRPTTPARCRRCTRRSPPSGGNIRELIIRMVKGDAFRHVRATGATP